MELDLRMKSIELLTSINDESIANGHKGFGGFGIGGYSVGEEHEVMFETLGAVAQSLPRTSRAILWGWATLPRSSEQ